MDLAHWAFCQVSNATKKRRVTDGSSIVERNLTHLIHLLPRKCSQCKCRSNPQLEQNPKRRTFWFDLKKLHTSKIWRERRFKRVKRRRNAGKLQQHMMPKWKSCTLMCKHLLPRWGELPSKDIADDSTLLVLIPVVMFFFSISSFAHGANDVAHLIAPLSGINGSWCMEVSD